MYYKNMKKLVYLIFISLLFTSCYVYQIFFNPYSIIQANFERDYDSGSLPNSGTLSSLFDYGNQEWDLVFYYGPYSFDQEQVYDDLGINSPFIGSSYNDGDWLLVFVSVNEDLSYSLNYILKGTSCEVSPIDSHYYKQVFSTDDLYTRFGPSHDIYLKKKN